MKKSVTYKSSGVDIGKANRFVRSIKGHVASTLSKAVLRDKKAFGSLFSLEIKNYRNPVLVSSTDGVGTKLLIAQAAGQNDSVGIDLVAMNVNDVLCMGARPLFFLDYIACGKVDVKVLNSVIKGIAKGCRQAGCSLIGGETAEMPGLYAPGEYDLAGFTVGIVDKDKMIDGSRIRPGDAVIGLASSGIHSNGYSLVRKVLSASEQKKLTKVLLTPTRIYVREVLKAAGRFQVKGIAHLTGGAFYEKLTKILPQGLCFSVDKSSWPTPKIFQKIQNNGRIKDSEMYRTFNMGIGMALVVSAKDAGKVCQFFRKEGTPSYLIGRVVKDAKQKIIFIKD